MAVASFFSLPVVQQQSAAEVSIGTELTQFGMAAGYGNIGILAHNTLSGAYFSQISYGQVITVSFEDGHQEEFVVTDIEYYRAMEPSNIYGDFINLENNHRLTAGQMFNKFYRGTRHLTLQTCVSADGNDSWGRLFIVAYPK